MQLDDEGNARAHQRADEIGSQIAKRYNIKPHLSGSLATGLNIPGSYDYDYGVTVQSPEKFQKLVSRLGKSNMFTPSPYNVEGKDMHVFQGQFGDDPVDLAIMFGEKGLKRRIATQHVRQMLEDDPEKRLALLKQKAAVKQILPHVPFVGQKLVKGFKRQLDEEIGLPRFNKQDMSSVLPSQEKAAAIMRKFAAELNEQQLRRLERSNVYGHRTNNLDAIIQSGKLLSAAQAAKAGLIKDVELAGANRGIRTSVDKPMELRREVFMTKGLMPSTGEYGPYGVMFEKRKAEPSRYLNTIPQEHLHEGQWRSKLHYVVPDAEFDDWQKKHPDAPFLRESQVPESKRLGDKAGIGELLGRVARIPKLTQAKELVTPKMAAALIPEAVEGFGRVGQLLSGGRARAIKDAIDTAGVGGVKALVKQRTALMYAGDVAGADAIHVQMALARNRGTMLPQLQQALRQEQMDSLASRGGAVGLLGLGGAGAYMATRDKKAEDFLSGLRKTSGQVFNAGGEHYDVEKLWEVAKKLPLERLSVEDTKDYMGAHSWTGGMSPQEVLDAKDDAHGHMTRINKANLRYPVILAPNQGVIDGMHRMAKATKLGKDTLPVHRFMSWDEMAPAYMGHFPDEGAKEKISAAYLLLKGASFETPEAAARARMLNPGADLALQ
jgi:hypothetical protein